MTRAVPALYLVILVLFVTAGSLLTARTEVADPTADLPNTCSLVATDIVNDLFPDAAVKSETAVGDDALYGRWLAADGSVLIELRCARFQFSELGRFRDALAAAEAGDSTLLSTEPAAILAELRDGVIIRQLDEETGLYRTWFVADALTADEAEDVVERTLEGQDTSGRDA